MRPSCDKLHQPMLQLRNILIGGYKACSWYTAIGLMGRSHAAHAPAGCGMSTLQHLVPPLAASCCAPLVLQNHLPNQPNILDTMTIYSNAQHVLVLIANASLLRCCHTSHAPAGCGMSTLQHLVPPLAASCCPPLVLHVNHDRLANA